MDMEDDSVAILDDDEERELQELERYINGGVPGILPNQTRPQSEILRAPSVSHLSTDSTLVTARSVVRPASTVATTTVLHLHHPRERRGNVILYDKTPSTSYSFVKVVCVFAGLTCRLPVLRHKIAFFSVHKKAEPTSYLPTSTSPL